MARWEERLSRRCSQRSFSFKGDRCMASALPSVVSELHDVHDSESTGLLIKRNRSKR